MFKSKFNCCITVLIVVLVQLNQLIIAQKLFPLIPDLVADPSISQFQDTFYCYITTDGYNKGLSTSGPPVVWKSTDFVNWSFNGIYFPSAEKQLFWAPSGSYFYNNNYYLYPTVNTNIYAAVANNPGGPFKLAIGVDSFNSANTPKPLICLKGPKGTKGIDAQVFIDEDNTAYMVWAQRGIAKLNPDMVSLDSSSVSVLSTKRKGYSEGPYLFKRTGIYYYLYTLSGHENYQYAYMYSKISPFGPYEFPEQDIIATSNKNTNIYGPGHGCFFNPKGTDKFYFVYLEFGRGGTNRQIFANEIEFNSDGTIKPVLLNGNGIGYLGKQLLSNEIKILKCFASSYLPEIKIKPVKDTSLHRIENFLPENVMDLSNGTRWMASFNDSCPWIEADLGKKQYVKYTSIYFVKPTQGNSFRVEISDNTKNWYSIQTSMDYKIKSPQIVNIGKKTRYIKIYITDGEKGIWEMKCY